MNNPLNERKIQLTNRFIYISGDGTEKTLPAYSWQTAVTVQGQTLIRVGFGDYRKINGGYQEDDLKDVLDANGFLCRSDFM